MHVTIVGPAVGRPAVALHGLGGSTEQNLPALEAVATHYGLRIHAIDLPNHCRSGKVGILHFQVRHFADLATMALLLNRDTAGILGRLTNLGIFRAILELNLIAPLVTMQAVIPIMRKQAAGSIVNVSSGITFSALPGSGAYGASKAGLGKLSAVARAELASEGIAVSTMCPFVTGTEFIESIRAGHQSASQLESSHAPQPQPPEQVAEAILDLIKTGAEQADLVPEQFGGSYQG